MPADFDNYRSMSWHSSHENSTNKNGRLLPQPVSENPYLKAPTPASKKSKKADTIPEPRSSMKKKRGVSNVEELADAHDFIKQSDIKASTPLIIENVKRTESNKLDRLAFDHSMRQASTHFKNEVTSKSMLARPKEMGAVIMEVDESGLDQTQGNLVAQVISGQPIEDTEDKNTHYFSYHNQDDE